MSDPNTPQSAPEYPPAPGSSDERRFVEEDPVRRPFEAAPSPGGAGEAETMSTPETLSGIFFEPGRTFNALRARPRFLVAAALIVVSVMAFVFLLYNRVSYEQFVRQAIETNSRTADMPADEKEKIISMQTGPVFKAIAYVSPAVGITAFFFIGAALYLLGSMAMGTAMSYKQALSVWVYSSLPPALLMMVANIILLFLKSADDITPENAQRGLARANLGLLVNGAESPVLGTVLGLVDFFSIYGLVLAAVGVRKMTRLSSGASWAVVLIVWVVGAVLRVAMSAAFGQPMA
ncbi:MAG TPA: Yip1 family protein [Pyrinomonadaceae bacterium]|nr:Yip1 family protein [Pyrinomonadaceae bacterium]